MNWVDTLWPMISAASLTLALVYYLAWHREPALTAHLLIGVAAASVSIVGFLELAAMGADDPSDYARMVRWAHVPVAVTAVCVVGFVHLHYGVGNPVLAATAIATRIACLLPNFLSGTNLNYATIDSLRTVTFLGAPVSIPGTATPNPWMALGSANALLVAAFIAHAIFQLSRRPPSHDRTRAVVTCTSILVFALASGVWTWMVVQDRVDAPHLFAPMFLGVLLAMAYELAGGFSSAGRFAHSLERAIGRRRNARRRMLQAVDASGVGFWNLDMESGRIRLSHHACALFGVSPREALTCAGLVARMPAQDRNGFLAAIEAPGQEGMHCEFRVVVAQDTYRWLAASGRSVLDANGNRGVDGVLVDVTERKDSESRFRLVVEGASAPHIVVGPGGEVAFANQAAADIFGYPVEEIAGVPLRTLARRGADDAAAAQPDDWLSPTATGRSVELVGAGRGRSEPVPLMAIINPIPFKAAHYLLVSLIDLSGRKKAEDEEVLRRDEAVHLSRVSLLATLSGSLAHELSQPLAAILANAQAARRFLDRKTPDLDEVRESLAAIAQSDLRAAGIIKRLRALLRKDTPEFSAFDIGDAIEEVLGMVRSDLLVRGVSLCVEIERPLAMARGDSIQIQQVILNLVMNACDSMDGQAPPRRVLVRANTDDGHIRVTVVDHGSGVAAGDLERIFHPFHTSKLEGLGLGLAVCRMIILAHMGEIWAESPGLGKGTALSFRLPCIDRTTPPGESGPERLR